MGDARVVHARPEWFADPAHGFAWIRMIGALLVIYGHSSPLAGTGELFPPEWPLQPDEGVLMGFFAMSGFQITESWMRDPHPGRFAAKRILRLWPPMLTVTLGMALVIGPMITTLPAGEYFSAEGTWSYIFNNAGLLTLKHQLPGVFTANPWPDAVNGSLWTLPMELLAYAGLYALLLIGAAKHKYRWIAVAALVALVAWDRQLEATPGSESAGSLFSVPVESLVAFLVAFAFGVVLNLYRIPLSPLAALAGAGVLVLMPNSITASFWMTFVISYAVVMAGHFWPAKLTVPDVWVSGSYGVYVWGFPIQQLLAMAGIHNQWPMLICAAPLAYVMGTLSWKFIEDPTLKLRHYITPAPKKKEPDEAEPDDLDEAEYLDDFDDLEPEDPEDRDEPEERDESGEWDEPAERQAPPPVREPVREAPTRRRPMPPPPNRDGVAPPERAEPPRPVRRAATPPGGAPRPSGPRDGAPLDGPPRPAAPRPGTPPNGAPRNGAPPNGNGRPPGAQFNGLPPSGSQPPLGRPHARVRPPTPPAEESVLSKRLSGDLDAGGPPPTPPQSQPPGRRGRHARPEPPPAPAEETRPVWSYPERRDRR